MLKEEIKERTLTPKEVRTILSVDNKGIVELCKRASILPKKNSEGHTYFSYDEVKSLRKVQVQKGVTNPMTLQAEKQPQVSVMKSLVSSLQEMEANISSKIAKVIDEKLEGMDEVVVELIRCKTDNEALRQKVVDLNKEIYRLKNELSSYKGLGLGFFVKKDHHTWE